MTILVVDDEPEYRLVLKNVLMTEGFQVILAENGEDAYKKLTENTVDLVISDIYMPVLDGIRFHRMVRANSQYAQLPFLFVSAYDDQHTLEAVKDARYEGFLRKARPVAEMKEWIHYLMSPEDKRPKLPPGGARSRLNQQLRGGTR
ncbi:MAG: two-component response regulator [Bacteroidetes bacterium]|nr:two-component response regulator [Bacteroidota bacterium]